MKLPLSWLKEFVTIDASLDELCRRLGLDPTPYDPAKISGFAFGMGVDRIAMMKYGISDIGLLYSGDVRFLEQFA